MKWYYEKLGERHGPVSVQELFEVLDRGEITPANLVWREGMANWTPLRVADAMVDEEGDELAICVASGKVLKKKEMIPYGDKFVSPDHRDEFVQGMMESGDSAATDSDGIVPTDYSVNIGECLGRAWKTMSLDFWPIVGVSAVILMILWVSSYVGGGLVAIPVMAGLYYYLLRKARGQPAEMGDAFYGFSNGFLKFFLMNLVIFGIAMGIAIVGYIPIVVMAFASESGGGGGGGNAIIVVVMALFMVIFFLGMFYIQYVWALAPLICLDKDLPFWDSMKTSMKVFNGQFFWFMLFFIVITLINMGGMLLACVGLFITVPWTLLATVHLYESIFGGRRASALQQLEG